MENEGHDDDAAAAYPRCREQSVSEDVIVVTSTRRPTREPSEAVVIAAPEHPEKVFYKTKLCDKFEAVGRCLYEDSCSFAHGNTELRPPLPGNQGAPSGGGWRRPPDAEHDVARGGSGGSYHVGGKVCFLFRDKGTCHFGDKCTFPHVSPPDQRNRYPEGGPKQVDERRSATPHAGARVTAPSGKRGSGGSYVPPGAARSAVAPLPADPLGQQPEKDGRKTRLELLSRKKLSGIYGDWPEEF